MKLFWTCWRMRGLLASSAYGENTEAETKRLEKHLAACESCRKQADQFQRIAGGFQEKMPVLDTDLAPLLQKRIQHEKMTPVLSGARFRLHWTPLATTTVLAMVIGAAFYFQSHRLVDTAQTAHNTISSPVQRAMHSAEQLAQKHEYAKAYQVLKTAVEQYPDLPDTALAQRQRAELAFTKLRWYPEAYADYELLATRYYDGAFKNSPESIQRREILAEALALNFASLKALDGALQSQTDTFASLENVIGQYPGTYVASLAAEQLAIQSLSGTDANSPQNRLAAMQQARDRCKNPVAVAQLDMELGHIYARELNDTAKARVLYDTVKQSGNTSLARLADHSLQALNQSPRP